jgi:ribosomal protein L21E
MRKNIFNPIIVFVLVMLVSMLHSCSSSNDAATVGTPAITSFTPTAGGPVNTYVTIKGSFFSATSSKNTAKFNGVAATLVDVTTSSITALVPAGATSGNISVTVGANTGSSATSFAVTSGQPDPFIHDFSVGNGLGADGTAVTINGYNFSSTIGSNTVKFNGVTATVSSASTTALKVNVPIGAKTGKVTVSVVGSSQIATSGSDFTVPEPNVESFTPTFSIVGSTVVITGTNFSATAAKNIVKFNGTSALGTEVSINEPTKEKPNDRDKLTVIIPAGATTGKISVTVDGQTSKSKDDFTVN